MSFASNDYDHIPDCEDLTFTVIHPDKESETPINIHTNYNAAGGYVIVNGIVIGSQQLSELGMLFFSIAAKLNNCLDVSSALELLDGFKIPLPIRELQEAISDELDP